MSDNMMPELTLNPTEAAQEAVPELTLTPEAPAAPETEKKEVEPVKVDESMLTEQEKKAVEKAKPKKQRFKFLKEVRSELKRVTWPTRNEVLRWTGVVVGALLFFGIFVAVLDNLIVTPIVVGISSIGAGV